MSKTFPKVVGLHSFPVLRLAWSAVLNLLQLWASHCLILCLSAHLLVLPLPFCSPAFPLLTPPELNPPCSLSFSAPDLKVREGHLSPRVVIM